MSDIISPFRWVYIFEPFLYSGQNNNENFNILNIWKKNFKIVLIKLHNWIRRCLIQSWRNQFKLILQKRFTSKMNLFLYLSKPPTYPLVSRLVKISFRIVLWFFGFVLNFRPPHDLLFVDYLIVRVSQPSQFSIVLEIWPDTLNFGRNFNYWSQTWTQNELDSPRHDITS